LRGRNSALVGSLDKLGTVSVPLCLGVGFHSELLGDNRRVGLLGCLVRFGKLVGTRLRRLSNHV